MNEIKQKSWFGRNWPWVLPVGGCLTVIVLFIAGVGAAIFGVTKAISGSKPYEYAYEKATTHHAVIEALGTPIEKGFMNSKSNYSYNNGETTISLTIPIKGSRNSALIYVEGTKDGDDWQYSKLFVDIDNNDISDVDLLKEDL